MSLVRWASLAVSAWSSLASLASRLLYLVCAARRRCESWSRPDEGTAAFAFAAFAAFTLASLAVSFFSPEEALEVGDMALLMSSFVEGIFTWAPFVSFAADAAFLASAFLTPAVPLFEAFVTLTFGFEAVFSAVLSFFASFVTAFAS